MAGLNLVLAPGMTFTVASPDTLRSEPHLVIQMDRAALMASQRRFKAKLRRAWLHWLPANRQYGLSLDPGWERVPEDRNLVVFVHGLDSDPEHCTALFPKLRERGIPCGTMRYPNDQSIADSARLLSRELKRLAKEHPRRGVALVTHSLGGLVARAVIEDAGLDPGNVRQLIMVAPPNHGSALARFGFALDLWEHAADGLRNKDVRRLYDLVEDGMSEAAGDLVPGSALLRELNARPRNPRVRYAVFLGTDGPLREKDLDPLRQAFTKAGPRSRWVRLFGPRVDEWLADLDEVVEGRGDGAVAVNRGRLEGVDDTMMLKFCHWGVLGETREAGMERLHQEILKRLDAGR
jgi:pimeloyl-ACP methyl ester carboxylesterase